jgi:di/tripeptidase
MKETLVDYFISLIKINSESKNEKAVAIKIAEEIELLGAKLMDLSNIKSEFGVSAIQIASEAISKIKIGKIDEEITYNTGIIKDVTATNIILKEVIREYSRG